MADVDDTERYILLISYLRFRQEHLDRIFKLAQLNWENDGVIPLGVFRDVERDSYDELVQAQLANAKGDGDLQAPVGSGDTWSIT